ncbi:hypothetical protein WMF30_10865 [Sorangium sp. So ce134]
MSRIRHAHLSRREAILSKSECADTLMDAADQLEHEAHRGRFDFMSGDGVARYIADAYRRTAPVYLKRSRLRRKGAR